MTEPRGIDFPYQLEKPKTTELDNMDVTVLYIVADLVVARITTSEAFAQHFCGLIDNYPSDYVVVSKDGEVLWVVDGMSPGWYIPKSNQDVLDSYPELKGKF